MHLKGWRNISSEYQEDFLRISNVFAVYKEIVINLKGIILLGITLIVSPFILLFVILTPWRIMSYYNLYKEFCKEYRKKCEQKNLRPNEILDYVLLMLIKALGTSA